MDANPSDDVGRWIEDFKNKVEVSERDESLETGVHHTGVDGNTISVLSERIDGSYYLNCVTVDVDERSADS